jgi:hypothetical protein
MGIMSWQPLREASPEAQKTYERLAGAEDFTARVGLVMKSSMPDETVIDGVVVPRSRGEAVSQPHAKLPQRVEHRVAPWRPR